MQEVLRVQNIIDAKVQKVAEEYGLEEEDLKALKEASIEVEVADLKHQCRASYFRERVRDLPLPTDVDLVDIEEEMRQLEPRGLSEEEGRVFVQVGDLKEVVRAGRKAFIEALQGQWSSNMEELRKGPPYDPELFSPLRKLEEYQSRMREQHSSGEEGVTAVSGTDVFFAEIRGKFQEVLEKEAALQQSIEEERGQLQELKGRQLKGGNTEETERNVTSCNEELKALQDRLRGVNDEILKEQESLSGPRGETVVEEHEVSVSDLIGIAQACNQAYKHLQSELEALQQEAERQILTNQEVLHSIPSVKGELERSLREDRLISTTSFGRKWIVQEKLKDLESRMPKLHRGDEYQKFMGEVVKVRREVNEKVQSLSIAQGINEEELKKTPGAQEVYGKLDRLEKGCREEYFNRCAPYQSLPTDWDLDQLESRMKSLENGAQVARSEEDPFSRIKQQVKNERAVCVAMLKEEWSNNMEKLREGPPYDMKLFAPLEFLEGYQKKMQEQESSGEEGITTVFGTDVFFAEMWSKFEEVSVKEPELQGKIEEEIRELQRLQGEQLIGDGVEDTQDKVDECNSQLIALNERLHQIFSEIAQGKENLKGPREVASLEELEISEDHLSVSNLIGTAQACDRAYKDLQLRVTRLMEGVTRQVTENQAVLFREQGKEQVLQQQARDAVKELQVFCEGAKSGFSFGTGLFDTPSFAERVTSLIDEMRRVPDGEGFLKDDWSVQGDVLEREAKTKLLMVDDKLRMIEGSSDPKVDVSQQRGEYQLFETSLRASFNEFNRAYNDKYFVSKLSILEMKVEGRGEGGYLPLDQEIDEVLEEASQSEYPHILEVERRVQNIKAQKNAVISGIKDNYHQRFDQLVQERNAIGVNLQHAQTELGVLRQLGGKSPDLEREVALLESQQGQLQEAIGQSQHTLSQLLGVLRGVDATQMANDTIHSFAFAESQARHSLEQSEFVLRNIEEQIRTLRTMKAVQNIHTVVNCRQRRDINQATANLREALESAEEVLGSQEPTFQWVQKNFRSREGVQNVSLEDLQGLLNSLWKSSQDQRVQQAVFRAFQEIQKSRVIDAAQAIETAMNQEQGGDIPQATQSLRFALNLAEKVLDGHDQSLQAVQIDGGTIREVPFYKLEKFLDSLLQASPDAKDAIDSAKHAIGLAKQNEKRRERVFQEEVEQRAIEEKQRRLQEKAQREGQDHADGSYQKIEQFQVPFFMNRQILLTVAPGTAMYQVSGNYYFTDGFVQNYPPGTCMLPNGGFLNFGLLQYPVPPGTAILPGGRVIDRRGQDIQFIMRT